MQKPRFTLSLEHQKLKQQPFTTNVTFKLPAIIATTTTLDHVDSTTTTMVLLVAYSHEAFLHVITTTTDGDLDSRNSEGLNA